MSQDIFNDINPTVTSGTELANDILNPFKDAVVSGFSGTSRPANLQAGGYWIDTTNDPTSWDFVLYDGSNDQTIFTLNLSTGAVTLDSSGELVTIQRSSDDTIAPALKFLKERLAGGQTLDGDELADVNIVGTDSGGVEQIHATIKFTSTDNTSSTSLGSIMTIEMADEGSGSVAELFRIENGQFGFGTASPTNVIHAEGDGIRHTRNTDDTSSSKIILEKKRTTGDQVLNGDNIGEVDMQSTDDAASTFTAASIKSVALENHTSLARGTAVRIETTDTGATSPTTKVSFGPTTSFEENVLVKGNLTVQGTTTQVDTDNLQVKDANIVINDGGDDTTAEGAGITVERTGTDGSIVYEDALASKFKLGESGSEVEIADVSSAQQLTNKDIDGGTASNTNRITLPKAGTSTLDGLTRKEGTVFYDTDAKSFKGDDGTSIIDLGGGGTGFTYIEQGDGVDVSSWTSYANTTAGDRPDDFGGTPSGNVSLTSNSTEPLNDTTDIQFSKDANNRQGEGFYFPFTLLDRDLAKVLTVFGQYRTSANYQTGDITMGVVSSSDSFVNNFNVIPFTDDEIEAVNGVGNLLKQLQTDATDTDYRFYVHVASANASSYDFNFTIRRFDQFASSQGAAITDWEDFTPTGSWTSNVTYTGRRRQVGDTEQIQYRVNVNGTVGPATTTLSFDLPPGLSEDTSKLTYANVLLSGNISGTFGRISITQAEVSGGRIFPRALSLSSSDGHNTLDIDSTDGTPVTLNSSSFIDIVVQVPIQGRSSNTKQSTNLGNRLVISSAYRSADYSFTGGTGNFEAVLLDTLVDETASMFDSSLNGWEIPESGWYEISGALWVTTSGAVSTIALAYLINTSSTVSASEYRRGGSSQTTTGGGLVLPISQKAYFEKGTVIRIGLFSSSNITVKGSETSPFQIERCAIPQTLLGSEKVFVEATRSTSQSIPSATYTDVLYDTVDFDSHAAYDTSTGEFEAPNSLNYSISASWLTDSTSWSASNFAEIRISVSGSRSFVRTLDVTRAQTSLTTDFVVTGSTTVRLERGDIVKIQVYQNSGGALNLISDTQYTWLAIKSGGE